jgi:hypothetical protein
MFVSVSHHMQPNCQQGRIINAQVLLILEEARAICNTRLPVLPGSRHNKCSTIDEGTGSVHTSCHSPPMMMMMHEQSVQALHAGAGCSLCKPCMHMQGLAVAACFSAGVLLFFLFGDKYSRNVAVLEGTRAQVNQIDTPLHNMML